MVTLLYTRCGARSRTRIGTFCVHLTTNRGQTFERGLADDALVEPRDADPREQSAERDECAVDRIQRHVRDVAHERGAKTLSHVDDRVRQDRPAQPRRPLREPRPGQLRGRRDARAGQVIFRHHGNAAVPAASSGTVPVPGTEGPVQTRPSHGGTPLELAAGDGCATGGKYFAGVGLRNEVQLHKFPA